jgi:hypothetical protein
MSFETDQGQNIRRFKANGWIRVGFTKAIIEIAKKNVWLWEFVYHIEGDATGHKYNLNPNLNIVPKNQNDIKSLSIPKKLHLLVLQLKLFSMLKHF